MGKDMNSHQNTTEQPGKAGNIGHFFKRSTTSESVTERSLLDKAADKVANWGINQDMPGFDKATQDIDKRGISATNCTVM